MWNLYNMNLINYLPKIILHEVQVCYKLNQLLMYFWSQKWLLTLSNDTIPERWTDIGAGDTFSFFLNLSIITITCTIHREVWDLLHKFHLYLLIMNIYNALLKKGQKYLYFFQIINIKLANYQLFAVIFQASCNSFFSGDSNWAKSQSSILQGLLCSSQHNLCFHHSTH